MERITRQAHIDVPPAKVFGWLTQPLHMLEIWPSMVEQTNVQTRPDGTNSFDWTYKMAGVKFHGHCDTDEVEPDRLIVSRNRSGIPGTFRWSFQPRDGGTDVDLEVEYEMPGLLLGRLAAPFIRKLNEREAETLVGNLKERMEMREPASGVGA
jgi:uncharacterized protein YndB with AHSA1/START domain